MEHLILFERLDSVIPPGMTDFQMESFVLNDQLTPYKKVRQCIVEARGRLESAAMLEFDIDELKLEIQECRENVEVTEVARARADIKRKRAEYQLERKKKMVGFVQKEAAFFLGHANALVEGCFGGAELFIENMDDPAWVKAHEEEYWTSRLARAATTDVLQYQQGISKGTIDAIMNLPVSVQEKCLMQHADELFTQQNKNHQLQDLRLAAKD